MEDGRINDMTNREALDAAGLPDIGPEGVTTAGRRGLRVNGKPFVPIFAWWVDAMHLDKLAATGVNTALSPMASPTYAAAAGQRGIYVGADPRQELIGHPRNLMWMHDDEPDIRIQDGPRLTMDADGQAGQTLATVPADVLIERIMPRLRQRETACRGYGDGRPLFLNFSYLFLERFWGPDAVSRPLYSAMCATADVVSWDIYPIGIVGRADWLPLIWQGCDRLRSFAPDKPLMMFLECVRLREGHGARDPEEREMRNEAWQAIAAGACGIGWFTFGPETLESNFARRSFMISDANQQAMARINAEITARTDLVHAPELARGARLGHDGMADVVMSLRRDGDRVYFLAVNPRYEPQPLDLSENKGPHSLSLTYGDGVTPDAAHTAMAKLDAGALQQELAPLEVRIVVV